MTTHMLHTAAQQPKTLPMKLRRSEDTAAVVVVDRWVLCSRSNDCGDDVKWSNGKAHEKTKHANQHSCVPPSSSFPRLLVLSYQNLSL